MIQENQHLNPGYGNEICYECHGLGDCPYCNGTGIFAGTTCTACYGEKVCPVCKGHGTLVAGTYREWVARGVLPANPDGPKMMNLPPLPNYIECAALEDLFSEVTQYFLRNPDWWSLAEKPFRFSQVFQRPGFGNVEFCLTLDPPNSQKGSGKLVFEAKAFGKSEGFELLVSQHASSQDPIRSTVPDRQKLCSELIFVLLRLAPDNLANDDLWYDGSYDK